MLTAIAMINCSVDQIPEVAKKVAELPGVNKVYSVTGNVDLITLVEVTEYDELASIVSDQMGKIPGVVNITTHLAFRSYSRADLEDAFAIGLD